MGKITWIKLAIDMFDDEKIKIIDAMKERDLIHYVWIRLLIQAGKTNSAGNIFLNENIPYTKEMLSIIFNRAIDEIEFSLKILYDLKMIEIYDNNFINISNWEKHQNIEGLERIRKQTNERVAKHRATKKLEEEKKAEDLKKTKEDNKENAEKSKQEPKVIKENFDKDNNLDVRVYSISKYNEIYNENFENNVSCDDMEINNIEENNIINNNDSTNKVYSINEVINTSDVLNGNDLKCNVTITPQNKKEKRKKKKNKNQRESKKKENSSLPVTTFKASNGIHGSEESAKLLLKYCEDTDSMPGNITLSVLKYAISTHTERYVKIAIDKSIEMGKFDMAYINGILKNWKREGYPRNNFEGGSINGANCYGKSIGTYTSKFEGFKPKKPRKLTEEEREVAEKNLI